MHPVGVVAIAIIFILLFVMFKEVWDDDDWWDGWGY